MRLDEIARQVTHDVFHSVRGCPLSTHEPNTCSCPQPQVVALCPAAALRGQGDRVGWDIAVARKKAAVPAPKATPGIYRSPLPASRDRQGWDAGPVGELPRGPPRAGLEG